MCFPRLIHKVGCAQPFIFFHLFSIWESDCEFECPLSTHSSAVSVLERMLLLDPDSRATAAEALTLPYFTEFREPDEEKEAQPYDHSLDNTDLPLNQWKRKDEGEEKTRQWKEKKISEGWRLKGEDDKSCFIDRCPVPLVFRSHLHRDLNLPTSCARIQGNPTVRHKELAVQPGDQNILTYLFIFYLNWEKLSLKRLNETWIQFTILF